VALLLYLVALYPYVDHSRLAAMQVRYLTSFFQVSFSLEPDMQARFGGASAEEVGEATAEHCFKRADTDGDGAITYAEVSVRCLMRYCTEARRCGLSILIGAVDSLIVWTYQFKRWYASGDPWANSGIIPR